MARLTPLPVPLLTTLSVLAVIVSGSREAWVAIGAGLVAALVCRLRGRLPRSARVVASLLLVAAVALGAAALQPSAISRLTVAPSQVKMSLTLYERAAMQSIALDLWETRPLLGAGSGNFTPAARQQPRYARLPIQIVPVHNWLLLRLSEGGLLGAGIALILWAGPPLWLLYCGRGPRDALLAWSFAALATSQWFDYELLYWPGGPLVQCLLLALWLGSPRAAAHADETPIPLSGECATSRERSRRLSIPDSQAQPLVATAATTAASTGQKG